MPYIFLVTALPLILLWQAQKHDWWPTAAEDTIEVVEKIGVSLLVLVALGVAAFLVLSKYDVEVTLKAAPVSYWNETAAVVADDIGCIVYEQTGEGFGPLNKDMGECYLDGERVFVVTFRNEEQREAYEDLPALEGTWVMLGEGYDVISVDRVKPLTDLAEAVGGKVVLK